MPGTGSAILRVHQSEKRFLAPLPLLPEPFGIVCTLPVGNDCMDCFEVHQYSVPFRFVGKQVGVRGSHRLVNILQVKRVIATHPRGTDERVVIDPPHYAGESTLNYLAPMPLGKIGEILEQLGKTLVQQQPAILYQAVTEELGR